jgi:hypothetical protein
VEIAKLLAHVHWGSSEAREEIVMDRAKHRQLVRARDGRKNGLDPHEKGVRVTSLVRSQPASSTQLLLRILDRPELVAAVRELPATVLGSLIDRIGLEDAGELVALATSEQLQGVFDRDLWRAAAPGEDERFRPERFALWLEIMLESGEDFLVEQLCALPRDLLALAVHRLVLVVDMDALGQGFIAPSEEQQRLERALDMPLFEEWDEFRLLARDPMQWDAVWTAVLALDRDHHELLRAILSQCCALSAEYVEEQGGWLEVLTSEEMLEGDVAGEREERRAAEGFVAPADARSFLELARRGDDLSTRDPVTKAYFRALASGKPAPPIAERSDLVSVLEEAAVIEPARQAPIAALMAGPEAAQPKPVQLLQAALIELRSQHEEVFSQRTLELGYLANVLIAGSRGRRPRPVEALEQAIAVCNTGLERALGADRSLARAVALLEEIHADQLFRGGSHGAR